MCVCESVDVCVHTTTVLCAAQNVMHVGVNEGGILAQAVMSPHFIRALLKKRQGSISPATSAITHQVCEFVRVCENSA